MTDDPRCCGTGTCMIDDEGRCWCGQQWDGEKMCFKSTTNDATDATRDPTADAHDDAEH